MENTDQVWTEQTWVCIGQRVNRHNKLSVVFCPIVDDQLQPPMWYDGDKVWNDTFPGAMFKIEVNEQQRCRASKKRYIGTYSDRSLVAQWQLETEAAKTEVRYINFVKSEKKIDPLLELLKPLRQRYIVASAMERRIIEVIILEYLRNGNIHG